MTTFEPGSSVAIDGVLHGCHYSDGRFAILQRPDTRPGGPHIGDTTTERWPEQHPGNAGNMARYLLFEIVHTEGQPEQLGQEVESYATLSQAMVAAARLEQ